MPALSFLAFVGFALIALLFYGNATLEPISPEMVTPHHVVAPEPTLPRKLYLSQSRHLTLWRKLGT